MNTEHRNIDEVEYAFRLMADASMLNAWNDAFARFAKLAAKNEFVPVVLYIPSAYTAYGSTVMFRDPEIGEKLHQFSELQRSYLGRLAKRLGLRYVDASGPLADIAIQSGEPLYFPSSVHLTAAGNEAIARILAVRLRNVWQESTDAAGPRLVAFTYLSQPKPPS